MSRLAESFLCGDRLWYVGQRVRQIRNPHLTGTALAVVVRQGHEYLQVRCDQGPEPVALTLPFLMEPVPDADLA